jgi:hypothetical protein
MEREVLAISLVHSED